MKCFLIIFSVIVALTNAKPDDIELDDASAAATAEDASVNVSMGSNENVFHPIGIFTKYPDDPNEMFEQPEMYDLPDVVRMRRTIKQIHSAGNENQEMAKADEQDKEEPAKVPLQGIITAIETDLVTTALLASTQLHKRQSMEHEHHTSIKNDSIDANEYLFKDLFNFTRPESQTDGKENVNLNGLVNAVESTLINSAQNLKDAEHEINSNSKSDGLLRIDRDTSDETVQVQTLDGNKSLQNLNILSSIALKPVRNDTEFNTTIPTSDGNDDDDDKIQGTNSTVVHASDTVSLISDSEDKLAHVQHQAISKTIFQSNLAIFPTIAPNSFVTSLSTITSAEQTSKEEANSANATNKIEQNAKRNELLRDSLLREKIAEVQAPPVILSSFP